MSIWGLIIVVLSPGPPVAGREPVGMLERLGGESRRKQKPVEGSRSRTTAETTETKQNDETMEYDRIQSKLTNSVIGGGMRWNAMERERSMRDRGMIAIGHYNPLVKKV